ncbi:putative BPI/LBP family protein At1g04970 isoform X2 [Ricinus communis]|uniref:putative BPI/LBP family protein At1g04970 isoform X2 n=1 Tax=Ricinus communis TaxID=3988 RepID=UPI00201A7560|nr:putative BPI/LBP family protein At1g04970 isoform X2 [Ricinus communis]
MAPTFLFLLLISSLLIPSYTQNLQNPDQESFISILISQNGLDFIKNLLITKAISSIIPLKLPNIEKTAKIPFLGNVDMVVSNFTIYEINVLSSYVKPGDSGIAIIASGTTCNLSMNWYYQYSTWLLPVEIADKGRASVQVEGMQVGLSLGLENQNGTLKLSLMDCGCYVKDISIKLDGGASWLYQGMIDAFEEQIGAAVESAITKKLREAILEFDSFLQALPKEIPVDDNASLNVTFVKDPSLSNSTIGFNINGLFTAKEKIPVPMLNYKNSQPSVFCTDPSKMLGISLDEAVFNSASALYYDDIRGSGSVRISGNKLGGSVKLIDFSMSLKWSNVGNLRLYLVQPVMWTLIQTVFLPYANAHLGQGFPLPIIRGFTLQNAEIILSSATITVCSDLEFTESQAINQLVPEF